MTHTEPSRFTSSSLRSRCFFCVSGTSVQNGEHAQASTGTWLIPVIGFWWCLALAVDSTGGSLHGAVIHGSPVGSLYYDPAWSKLDTLFLKNPLDARVGPSLTLPTASDDQFGSGRWSGGITGVVLSQANWGSMGILGRQLWSFVGYEDRGDVSQLLVEPFLNYNLDKGWFLLLELVATAN